MSNTKLLILTAAAMSLAALSLGINAYVPRETVIVGAEDDCREFYGAYHLEAVERRDPVGVVCLYW